MNTLIADAMAGLVGELAGAGVPATADPDIVMATIAEQGTVALVGPPITRLVGMAGVVELEFPISLTVNPPGNYADWLAGWAALPAAMFTAGANEARVVVVTLNPSAVLPAYRFTCTRSYRPDATKG